MLGWPHLTQPRVTLIVREFPPKNVAGNCGVSMFVVEVRAHIAAS